MKPIFVGLLILGLLLCGAWGVSALVTIYQYGTSITHSPDNWQVVNMADSRIKLGDSRESALSALSDAWYHGECELGKDMIKDLFFYGPKERTQANVVIVTSVSKTNQFQVTHIGSFETDLILYFYQDDPDCLPPEFRRKSAPP